MAWQFYAVSWDLAKIDGTKTTKRFKGWSVF